MRLVLFVTVDSFDADADTITLSDDLSDNFADADTFTIRPAATLATVFGADNSAGIDAGSGGTAGADQIWVPNATGGFDKYYYDGFNTNSFTATWTDGADGSAVTAADIAIIYTDGLIILGAGTDNNTFVVSGSGQAHWKQLCSRLWIQLHQFSVSGRWNN